MRQRIGRGNAFARDGGQRTLPPNRKPLSAALKLRKRSLGNHQPPDKPLPYRTRACLRCTYLVVVELYLTIHCSGFEQILVLHSFFIWLFKPVSVSIIPAPQNHVNSLSIFMLPISGKIRKRSLENF
jgi:hypothetical protein